MNGCLGISGKKGIGISPFFGGQGGCAVLLANACSCTVQEYKGTGQGRVVDETGPKVNSCNGA
jgi:hypothetical protein